MLLYEMLICSPRVLYSFFICSNAFFPFLSVISVICTLIPVLATLSLRFIEPLLLSPCHITNFTCVSASTPVTAATSKFCLSLVWILKTLRDIYPRSRFPSTSSYHFNGRTLLHSTTCCARLLPVFLAQSSCTRDQIYIRQSELLCEDTDATRFYIFLAFRLSKHLL